MGVKLNHTSQNMGQNPKHNLGAEQDKHFLNTVKQIFKTLKT